jgi:hypothetical protein
VATGISLSGTSNLSTGQRRVIASARIAFEPAAPDPDLVENHRIGQGERIWDLLTYARLSQANALTEGVDVSETQQLVAASLSVTPSEHGIITTLSKRLIRRQGDTDVVDTTGRLLAVSLRIRMANDIIALYDGFSKSVVGASTAMDVTHFRGGVAYLMTDNESAYGPAPPPFVAALHIEQISDIILDISDPGTAAGNRPAGFGDDLLQRWWRGSDRLYGVSVFHSGNISRDGSDDAKGAIMASSALVLVMATSADVTEESDNSLRSIEYGLFQEWSEGEAADPHGIEVYSDASATV